MDDSSHSDYYFLQHCQFLLFLFIPLILHIKMSQHGFMLHQTSLEVAHV